MNHISNLFIASSVEGLEIAETVKALLEHSHIRAEIWTQGTFSSNGYPLEQLEIALQKHEYGLFVMTPDDIVTRRGENVNVARDNLYLELGMFIGKYGRKNCFILVPRGESSPVMPSDLTGFNTLTYDPSWEKDSSEAALGNSVRELKKTITKKEKTESISENIIIPEEQISILKVLFNTPKSIKAERIREYLKIEHGFFYYHINNLENNNNIKKEDNYNYIITDKGRKLVVEML
ncbi:nucleotide-binding protein [Photobacterium andalusiense]|uniref:Putative nucleotide-binding protein containing TIR-like domain protein n=1 Tax=Photobacterium andalusiense TaxID=2204296 RepID=A0A1Y6MLN0_9GAMM|nr:nucleotide-binding protein [Photobacterium andalusiense]SMY37495.1 putative nucleotide-binding protein containing TIR-like domain protein [Photobacterium andalusiense]